ncbi:S8 family peptidase [Lysobacter enzymogenes]|uniref:S8 family peptidase n=1 Tax=Lysobacter enzymogenes TaxID=69 RepID=UPI000899C303|nr:S8 family peptidase [Lysobacter enzymogenes]SDX60862.1 Serine protease, subtilisin family [Lysobacter enzymogenes]
MNRIFRPRAAMFAAPGRTAAVRRAGVVLVALTAFGDASASDGYRKAMTWTVLNQGDGLVRVGADTASNAYLGDTRIDAELPLLCVSVDGRAAPGGIAYGYDQGWLGGEVKTTPAIHGAVLTSREKGDEICADRFGQSWRLAEFHDGRFGADFQSRGGWTFWAAGQLPAGARFWTAIDDQPANAWNSAGDVPAVQVPKFLPSEAPVPDQYVVSLREDTPDSSVETLAQDLLNRYGGTVINVFPTVQGFSFTGSAAQAQAMSDDALVESVEEDTYGEAAESWHRDRVDQRQHPLDGRYVAPNDGSGVNIYVLDSGFRRSHEQFGGRASQQADFIRFMGSRDDCYGHGTRVASAAGGSTLGVAPGANLISVRISGCRGWAHNPLNSLTTSTIVAGLDWVTRHHVKPAVVNISYGFSPGFWRRWFGWRTPQDRAVRRAVQAGITVVVSAGNEHKNANRSTPARAPEAISVGYTDYYDVRAYYSNYGKVDIFAPGVSLTLANLDSDSDYIYDSGSSYAAPLVAGAAALYLHDHPNASPAEVREALQNNATHDVVGDAGPGSANRLLYIGPLPVNPHTPVGASGCLIGSVGYVAQKIRERVAAQCTSLGGSLVAGSEVIVTQSVQGPRVCMSIKANCRTGN